MLDVKLKVLDVRYLNGEWPLPEYATVGSAGFDLRAAINEPLVLAPGECQLIGTGLCVYQADPNYVGDLVPRSGLGHKHGIILGNGIGTIDSDYQGELKISCWNRSPVPYKIEPGERIAQMVYKRIEQAKFTVVDEFETSDRGEGGFGSSGRS